MSPARGSVDPDRLYTYQEIAELAGATERRVRRWVEEGKLAFTTLPGGRGRRILGATWLAAIAEHTEQLERAGRI